MLKVKILIRSAEKCKTEVLTIYLPQVCSINVAVCLSVCVCMETSVLCMYRCFFCVCVVASRLCCCSGYAPYFSWWQLKADAARYILQTDLLSYKVDMWPFYVILLLWENETLFVCLWNDLPPTKEGFASDVGKLEISRADV